MNKRWYIVGLVVPLLAAGCAVAPTGPSLMALPGSGRGFDEFQRDDANCRQHALIQIGGEASVQAANNAAVGSAVVGTAIGALAGAALGGRDGSGAGAGMGLIIGSSAGIGASQNRAYGSQRQYDNAYIQCMYGHGHKVPVSGEFARTWTQMQAPSPAPPAPGASVPPPPPR